VRGLDLLPEALPGFRAGRSVETDRLFLGSVRFTRSVHESYVSDLAALGRVPVSIFVGEDARRERSVSILSPKNRVPGRGWSIEAVEATEFPLRYRGERVTARSERQSIVSYVFYLNAEAPVREGLRAFLALDQSPLARPGRTYVVRLTTELEPGPQGPRLADRRLREGLRGLDPHLRELEAWRPRGRG
jgi:hypothetical protein